MTNGSGRCHLHGGKSLRGIAHPNWKTGRYSKWLGDKVLDKYLEAINDPELLSTRDEMAVLRARAMQILDEIDVGDSKLIWRNLRKAFRAFEKAYAANDEDRVNEHLLEVRRLVYAGGQDWEKWAELQAIFENIRRLAETERKRLVEMQQMITSERAYNFVTRLAEIVRAHVDDPKALNAISDDFRRELSRSIPANIDS